MIDDTNIERFMELHAEGTPFKEIVSTLGMTPEEVFICCSTALSGDFELCEDPQRCRPKQAYLDLIAGLAAFVMAGK
jgi:hypothetical protein